MTKLRPAEYQQLKRFLQFFSERFFDLGSVEPHLRPLAFLEAFERTAPSRAAAGLRMAVNDCVEMSSHWPVSKVAALDTELTSKGIVSLSQVRQRYWGRYAAVLKRGRIRSDVEYYLVQGVLVDQASTLQAPERERLQELVSMYEQSAP